jgi:hypothetical protein
MELRYSNLQGNAPNEISAIRMTLVHPSKPRLSLEDPNPTLEELEKTI